jgi:hypothetical protein
MKANDVIITARKRSRYREGAAGLLRVDVHTYGASARTYFDVIVLETLPKVSAVLIRDWDLVK